MAKKPIKYLVVDAFTDAAFKGNPAAVCFLDEDKDDAWLQSLASEFNISETCYLTPISNSPIPRFRLRWFTPVAEVELCGHATLAASHALFTSGLVHSNTIEFYTLSGILTAKRILDTRAPNVSITQNGRAQNGQAQESFLLQLDFPTVPLTEYDLAEVSQISTALNGASFTEIKKTMGDDIVVRLPTGMSVEEYQPQFEEIEKCPGRGVMITGAAPPGSGFDFYSRFFCPKLGINEDPVCGSAHCALALYWSEKLGKNDLVAYAASPRGGIVRIHLDNQNQRVLLQGKAVTVMEGTILV